MLIGSAVLPFVTPEPALSYLPGYWLIAVVHLYYLLWAFSVSLMVNAAINRKLTRHTDQTLILVPQNKRVGAAVY
ncbi:MAG: hypothetical protein IPL73_24880 [Candidatus Obscuribacter sp.]|nr:hypothetical protein [Candidatus Obscuribacter sp.]